MTDWRVFDTVLADAGRVPGQRLRGYAAAVLDGVDWYDKRVLDLGCGDGSLAVYLALSGAAQVIGIDPESAGSEKGATSAWPRYASLNLSHLLLVRGRFEEHPFRKDSFDLIISINSINHLHEVESDLRHDRANYETTREVLAPLAEVASPGARLLVVECSRRNPFAPLQRYQIRNPLPGMSTIEWTKHQLPEVWIKLLCELGFECEWLRWYVPNRLRPVGWLVKQRWFNELTFSSFRLLMYKR